MTDAPIDRISAAYQATDRTPSPATPAERLAALERAAADAGTTFTPRQRIALGYAQNDAAEQD